MRNLCQEYKESHGQGRCNGEIIFYEYFSAFIFYCWADYNGLPKCSCAIYDWICGTFVVPMVVQILTRTIIIILCNHRFSRRGWYEQYTSSIIRKQFFVLFAFGLIGKFRNRPSSIISIKDGNYLLLCGLDGYGLVVIIVVIIIGDDIIIFVNFKLLPYILMIMLSVVLQKSQPSSLARRGYIRIIILIVIFVKHHSHCSSNHVCCTIHHHHYHYLLWEEYCEYLGLVVFQYSSPYHTCIGFRPNPLYVDYFICFGVGL